MQYKCSECEKFFRNKDLLKRHIAHMHGDLAIKSYINNQQKTRLARNPATNTQLPKESHLARNVNRNESDESKLNEPEYLSTEIETQTPQQFQVKTPGIKDESRQPTPNYYCVDCGYAPIPKGQKTCPSCGMRLDWGRV